MSRHTPFHSDVQTHYDLSDAAGSQLPLPMTAAPLGVPEYAREAGFTVTRIHPLQLHYAKTLDCWAENLIEGPAPGYPVGVRTRAAA